jgi:hypothetical protein
MRRYFSTGVQIGYAVCRALGSKNCIRDKFDKHVSRFIWDGATAKSSDPKDLKAEEDG